MHYYPRRKRLGTESGTNHTPVLARGREVRTGRRITRSFPANQLGSATVRPPEAPRTITEDLPRQGGPGRTGEHFVLPAVLLNGLNKTFGTVHAVENLSLVIWPGEILGLLGPNGSGKTTTINMVSGLATPDHGAISLLGYDLRHPQAKHLLGVVPQETALYEELTAWRNMEFHADLFGIPRAEKKERISRLLTLVHLLSRKDCRVGTFSGGMKRRLALARALLHDPHVLLLDEPTLGVDVQARRAIWDYILALRQQGKTVLLTTNYLEEAQALCDRLAILDHGKLIAVGTPDALRSQFGGSLDDVFLHVTGRALRD